MRRMILTPRAIVQRERRLLLNGCGFSRSRYLSGCEIETRLVFGIDRSAAPLHFVRRRRPHPAYMKRSALSGGSNLRLSSLPGERTLFPEIDLAAV